MRGYVHEVVIACGAEVIVRHARSWEKEDYIYDPLHYLALIEQKANARDQANASSFRFCDCWKHSGSRTLKPECRAPLNAAPLALMQ